jgi:glycosyltransferase involved in cell wall biosynthesis
MKIAVWHNLPSGGGKRALYDHVRGLVARGHTVEAWCPLTADREFLPLGIPEHVVDLAWPPDRLIDKLGIRLVIKRQLAAMDAHCRACAEQIDRGGFDILFANSCKFLRTTPIGRFTKTPSVLYLQEPFRWLYEALPRLPWLALPPITNTVLRPSTLPAVIIDWRKSRAARLQAREEVDNAAGFGRILVNSYYSRESVLRAYGIDADVCYLGIDTDRFADKNLPRTKTLVGLGSITREKNVRLCIEAIGKLASPRPKLVWVGNVSNDSYLNEMGALAETLGVEFEAKIGISDTELLEILDRSMALLYAPRLEPFGLAPLEANACGLPVIAVAEGGVRETIANEVNGLVVDSNPNAMAAAINRLYSEPTLTRVLGINGRLFIEQKWGMNAAIDRIEQHLVRRTRAGSPISEERPNFVGRLPVESLPASSIAVA